MNADPDRPMSDAERFRLAGRLWVLYMVSMIACFIGAVIVAGVAAWLGVAERWGAVVVSAVFFLPFPLVSYRELKTGVSMGDYFYLYDRWWNEGWRRWSTWAFMAIYPVVLVIVYFVTGNR